MFEYKMILNQNLLFIQSFNFELLKENQDELELLCAFDVSLDKIRNAQHIQCVYYLVLTL